MSLDRAGFTVASPLARITYSGGRIMYRRMMMHVTLTIAAIALLSTLAADYAQARGRNSGGSRTSFFSANGTTNSPRSNGSNGNSVLGTYTPRLDDPTLDRTKRYFRAIERTSGGA
jgi:poly(3-hydroxybutyrate) depolymerase